MAKNRLSKVGLKKIFDDGARFLLGHRIVAIRPMTESELKAHDWYRQPWQTSLTVIELDNGGQLFAQSDDEGNDGGVLMMSLYGEKDFFFPVRPGKLLKEKAKT